MRKTVVVTGVPGSGTTMLMRMLEAGGIYVVADNHRPADDRHPDGYYEWGDLKTMTDLLSCNTIAAVKMAGGLAQYFPAFSYVLIIHRDSHDSQIASGESDDEAIKHVALIERMLQISRSQRLDVYYDKIIEHPIDSAQEIAKFLDVPLDVESMARAVNPSLRHFGDPR